MGWGIIFPLLMTLIIVTGPFIRALEDRDYYEILIDIFLIVLFWAGYYFLASANTYDIFTRILNKLGN